MKCPDPKCQNPQMSFIGHICARESQRLFRCTRCGCELTVKGKDTFLSLNSLHTIDRNANLQAKRVEL